MSFVAQYIFSWFWCEQIRYKNHFNLIHQNYSTLLNKEISVFHTTITLKPFDGWTEQNPPLWWLAYNKQKHHRSTDFKLGNLENCLNAGAALTLLLMKVQKENGLNQTPYSPGIELKFFGDEYCAMTVVAPPSQVID